MSVRGWVGVPKVFGRTGRADSWWESEGTVIR
ncbi:hypothetical protein SFR_5511 [Streptomyces sp. FR-008]|nr:hypothetical protein SFR_5511 [Streptomyces sp. FR-008]